ncbi:MAG: WbqC family protein, partial [Candidatus Wildermuthbacteria bacterium]|nr:WbqC family protein [Candidatus Wildermuthbacteria bacterium]
ILTAHQPQYLPWLGLFHKIALSDEFCFFDIAQYRTKSFNRNQIKTPQGAVFLTVPVLTKGYQEKKFFQMQINNAIDWRKDHFKSLYVNYKKAPFFGRYIQFFDDLYKKDWQNFCDLTEYMLRWFLQDLKIEVAFSKASERNFEGSGSNLVLDMCKKAKAGIYIFGTLGKNYANVSEYEKAGVHPYFQDYSHPQYSQLWGEFLPYMSIADLLFNCGPKSLEVLMRGNITKEELKKLF